MGSSLSIAGDGLFGQKFSILADMYGGWCLSVFSFAVMRDAPPGISFQNWNENDPLPSFDDDVTGFVFRKRFVCLERRIILVIVRINQNSSPPLLRSRLQLSVVVRLTSWPCAGCAATSPVFMNEERYFFYHGSGSITPTQTSLRSLVLRTGFVRRTLTCLAWSPGGLV